MITRALFAAAGLLAAGLSPAFANSVTAAVAGWDAASRTITLEDRSQFADIPAKVAVPTIKNGDLITVDYLGDENGSLGDHCDHRQQRDRQAAGT